jgi:GT2 family glycosyltransferase
VTTAVPADAALTLTARVFELPTGERLLLPASLQVSIVTYRPDLRLLERCFRKLVLAIGAAREDRTIRTVALAIIDNSEDRAVADKVRKLGQTRFRDANVQTTYLHGHANIGYGAAHNLVLHGSGADYHLVMNPDIELAPDAIAVGVRWLSEHPDIGAIAPEVLKPDGSRDYLCKRYPAAFDLLLRGFAPRFVRALFRSRLARYEMRDVIDLDPRREIVDIPAMSGACLLVKRAAIDATGGFDPGFFLYFEDYDWTVRLNRVTRTAYLPLMRVVHHGGQAARKGFAHIGWFVRSGVRFYRKHGWRLF